MKGLKDKIVLVTGGAKGLGKAMATRFLQEGATVVIADVDAEASAATVEELGTLGPIEAYQIDLRDADAIEAMVDYVAEKYGRIDIAVNNAGVQIHGWATEFPLEKFDMMLSLNLRAYYLVARAAARYMKKQGGGSIVCISSGNSQCFTSQRSAYNISKAAVNGLVATLGVEWARFNIRINAVAPGYVMTEMIQKGINEGIIDIDNIMKVIPMKRLLMPEEIGNSVVFLASDEASGITGQTLFTDGGWSKAGLPEEKDM